MPKHKPIETGDKHSFCESVTGIGPWHIRKLTEEGLRLGGGIDTPSLCGRVAPRGEKTSRNLTGLGGWDLNVPITTHHLTHCCPACAAKYKEL